MGYCSRSPKFADLMSKHLSPAYYMTQPHRLKNLGHVGSLAGGMGGWVRLFKYHWVHDCGCEIIQVGVSVWVWVGVDLWVWVWVLVWVWVQVWVWGRLGGCERVCVCVGGGGGRARVCLCVCVCLWGVGGGE